MGTIIQKKYVYVYNVETEALKKILLPDMEECGGFTEFKKKGGKAIQLSIHNGGSGPFYQYFTIDIENCKITNHTED